MSVPDIALFQWWFFTLAKQVPQPNHLAILMEGLPQYISFLLRVHTRVSHSQLRHFNTFQVLHTKIGCCGSMICIGLISFSNVSHLQSGHCRNDASRSRVTRSSHCNAISLATLSKELHATRVTHRKVHCLSNSNLVTFCFLGLQLYICTDCDTYI